MITLTIIGVVAALTIPTLMTKYQKHQYVVGLKKMYAQLQNAIPMIPIETGCPTGDYACTGILDYIWDGGETQTKIYAKVLKTQKICTGEGSYVECLGNNYPSYEDNMHSTSSGVIVLADGSAISLFSSDIIVDVNGAKGPNKEGLDIFRFQLAHSTQNGVAAGTLIPYGSNLEKTYNNYDTSWYHGWKDNCKTETIGMTNAITCTGRVLEEDAMNY